MTEYKIAIPSYRRADTLREKTLALLQRYKIPMGKIYIFVASEAEKIEYLRAIPGQGLHYCKDIIVAKPGMMAVRNFIQSWFPEGQRVVNIDDDIEALKVRVNDYDCEELEDLDGLIQKGFSACEAVKASLWGVYPIVNPKFMYSRPTQDLRYIIGAFWGVINTHDKDTYVTMDDKEDFERTIKFYIRDGRVVRLNHVGIKSAYYTEPGGMQETRTEKRVRQSGMELLQKYPMFCEYNKARKKHFEIRLVDKTRK